MKQITDLYLRTRLSDSCIDSLRRHLDPYIHDQFIERRRKIQNSMVRELISQLSWRSLMSDRTLPILTCLVGENEEKSSSSIRHFIEIDTNAEFLSLSIQDVRTRIPEFARYQQMCPHLAASLTQKEAETVLELTIYASAYLGLHSLVVLPVWDTSRLRHFLSSIRSSCDSCNSTVYT